MHYVYPYPHVDDVIPLMAERQGAALPRHSVPAWQPDGAQAHAPSRPGREDAGIASRAWRETCPDLTIRSTFIVGFPGETEAEFEELLAWLDEAQLDRVGAFKYSPVEGAAANDVAPHVPPEVQEERLARFMEKSARSAPRTPGRQGRAAACACWSTPSTATRPSRAARVTRRRSTAPCASREAANSRSASSRRSRSPGPAITISKRRLSRAN